MTSSRTTTSQLSARTSLSLVNSVSRRQPPAKPILFSLSTLATPSKIGFHSCTHRLSPGIHHLESVVRAWNQLSAMLFVFQHQEATDKWQTSTLSAHQRLDSLAIRINPNTTEILTVAPPPISLP